MQIPKLYIGTAGWSYDDWVGSFYPFSQSKEFSWLKYYSRFFNTVEVNSTYYTYLAPNVIKNWLRLIEEIDEFLFTVKLHMDFTHRHSFSEKQIKAVQYNLDILKDSERLGGLLLQFPYSFDCNNANVDYLRGLLDAFSGYDKFVEVRHQSWQNKRAKTITFCSIDQPKIGAAIELEVVAGNNAAYVRLHGRNAEAWKKSLDNYGKKQTYNERSARCDYLYTPGELVEIADKVKELYDKVKKIFVITNNHPHGNAVANAFELMHYLDERTKIKMPETIVKAYPRLSKFTAI